MGAIERAREDVQVGDLGLARQRLASFLASQGYDAEALEELGRVCLAMRDLRSAGGPRCAAWRATCQMRHCHATTMVEG